MLFGGKACGKILSDNQTSDEIKMSLIIEKEGKTVEQALEKGLLELGVRREDTEVEIVSLGSSGFLGIFGAKPAKIRI